MQVPLPRTVGSWITYGVYGFVFVTGVIDQAFGGLMLFLSLGVPLVALTFLVQLVNLPSRWRDSRGRSVLGEALICDHLPDGAHTPRHRVLYMSAEEKLEALAGAGLVDAKVVWSDHDMAFYRARASGQP